MIRSPSKKSVATVATIVPLEQDLLVRIGTGNPLVPFIVR